MADEFPRDKYRAAFDEANQELKKIHSDFERLSLRHDRIAKVVEVLGPNVRLDSHVPVGTLSLTSRRAGLRVVTRVAIVEKPNVA